MKKTAIVLFNLGGPDASEAVKPFLFNLFRDPAIIRLPALPRLLIAWLISHRRTKIAREIYAKIGGRSPILENTVLQARALETALGGHTKCFIAMRYWHPFVEGCVEAVKRYDPDRIILLPLYPQFSTTTTASSLKSWHRAAKKNTLQKPTKTICCYPTTPGFIRAIVFLIRESYDKAKQFGTPRLLLSAHGLPESIVKDGDPYAMQCQLTVDAIRAELNIEALDAVLCYQSRVGPLKWIGPATDDEIRRAAADRVPLVIAPIAFVSEHSETLVELDIEYRHLAEKAGLKNYFRVPTVATHPDFIEALADLVREASAHDGDCLPGMKGERCGRDYKTCPCASRS